MFVLFEFQSVFTSESVAKIQKLWPSLSSGSCHRRTALRQTVMRVIERLRLACTCVSAILLHVCVHGTHVGFDMYCMCVYVAHGALMFDTWMDWMWSWNLSCGSDCPAICCDMWSCFIEAHGFSQELPILGGSGNSGTPSHTYRCAQARVVRLSPVTTGLQTQRDLVAYSNPSGSGLPKQAAAVSQAELQTQAPGWKERQQMRKRNKLQQKNRKSPPKR